MSVRDPGIDPLRRQFAEALRRAEIVSLVNAANREEELGKTFTEELAEVFDAEVSFVIAGSSASSVPRLIASVGLSRGQARELVSDPLCEKAMQERRPVAIESPELRGVEARSLALSPFRTKAGRPLLIGVARLYDEPFDAIETALLKAVSDSAAHALERIWAYEERDRRSAQQAALVRAAKALNCSLETDEILTALCREVVQALEADKAAAYLGNERDGYDVVGIAGFPESFRGFHRPPGQGLGAAAVREEKIKVSQDYRSEGLAPPDSSALDDIRVAIAVPLRWDQANHGFLSVGFTRERRLGEPEIELVEGFADLAALACANAERHAAVLEFADQDQLTGCLNQGAFRRFLRYRIAEAERDGSPLSLVLLDLDGFKHVNDTAGHPAGDSVLREVGSLILTAVRGEDTVARYGGDEFAIILPRLEQEETDRVLERLLASLQRITLPVPGELSGCAGVATRHPGEGAQSLIDRADAALLDAKRQGRSRTVFSDAEARESAPLGPGTSGFDTTESRRRRRELAERLQALAGRIGLRISRETTLAGAADVAVEELSAALEADECVVLRALEGEKLEPVASFLRPGSTALHTLDASWRDAVAVRCLREGKSIVDSERGTGRDNGRRASSGDLAVPVPGAEGAWGVIACRAEGGRFGPEDTRLAEAVADHLGTTARAVELNDELRSTLIGVSESLVAALQARDRYTGEHARDVARLALAVGVELGLDEEQLSDLRFGAIFHDVGKIALPDSILRKEGPLSDEEEALMRRHPIIGEEILAPLPMLAGARAIVRHDREHWDGSGYPDGLRGQEIPLGARIVLVADAYCAMVSDRPYRAGMSHEEACANLRRGSGRQFDPDVVLAFLKVVEREPALLNGPGSRSTAVAG